MDELGRSEVAEPGNGGIVWMPSSSGDSMMIKVHGNRAGPEYMGTEPGRHRA